MDSVSREGISMIEVYIQPVPSGSHQRHEV